MSTTSGRRRAQAACQFCRKRKLKCGNEQPRCNNCVSHDRDCVFADLPKRERPSRDKVNQLEKEILRLKALLDERFQPPTDDGKSSMPLEGDAEAEIGTDSIVDGVEAAHTSRTSVFTGDSLHGPTSTLHNEPVIDTEILSIDIHASSSVEQETAGRELFAEAAYQRQCEPITLAAGRLDCDGIESQLAMHLLELHWNRQHLSFLISYRPAFMRDMACAGPYFSKLLLNAMYFGACKYSDRTDIRAVPEDARSAGMIFRDRFKQLLTNELDRSSITSIQALLIMSSALFASGEENTAAWLYSGLAFRMIIDMGLQVDRQLKHGTLSHIDQEIRRRVYWGAFCFDKIQSLYQGRRATLRPNETHVALDFADKYEELEHWTPLPKTAAHEFNGAPTYAVSNLEAFSKLAIIIDQILEHIYAAPDTQNQSRLALGHRSRINGHLTKWYQNLPPHLSNWNSGICPPPHVLSTLSMYHVLLILLHRPFVEVPAVSADAFEICRGAADAIVQIVRAYDRAFSVRKARYLLSYATYVAATIHVRVAAQKGPRSEARACLGVCLQQFRHNQETNRAVRRANTVIHSLMKKFKVEITEYELEQVHGLDQTFDHLMNFPYHLNATFRYDEDMQVPQGVTSDNVDDGASPEMDMSFIMNSFAQAQQSLQGQMLLREPMHTTPVQAMSLDASGVQSDIIDPASFPEDWQTDPFGINDASLYDLLYGFGDSAWTAQ